MKRRIVTMHANNDHVPATNADFYDHAEYEGSPADFIRGERDAGAERIKPEMCDYSNAHMTYWIRWADVTYTFAGVSRNEADEATKLVLDIR